MNASLALTGAVCLGLTVLPVAAETTTNAISALQEACQASLNEPWRSVPWRTSLIEAQHQAATERKPIFIWAMDGHPLGCT